MDKTSKANYVVIILMVLLPFTNIFGLNIAGISIPIGIAAFFTDKAVRKESLIGSVLDVKSVGSLLKKVPIWLWIVLPLLMDALSILISRQFFPDFIAHVVSRTEGMVSFEITPGMLFQIAILALGEEIAWRAFLQKQLQKRFPAAAVIIASSVLFAIAHYASGRAAIVAYDIFFVFINSCIYATIFYKTNNAWICTISHFIANLFSIIVVSFL